jgi:hypothetical protein
MAKIAVLSSTNFKGSTLDTLFVGQLPAGTAVTYYSAGGNYDAASAGNIKQVANTIDPTNLDLIVAVGGLVSAQAVSDFLDDNNLNIKFLILIGRAPNETSGLWNNKLCIGGINLDTANQNAYRATCLVEHKWTGIAAFAVNNVCLLYNQNSHMGAREAKDWSFFGPTKRSTVSQTGYDKKQFVYDFSHLPAQAKAIIVSSDPFFTSNAADIIAAAKNWGNPVCYPNELYGTATTGISMIYGPDLKTAYKALGVKAATYLAAATKPASVGLDSPHPPQPNYL